MMNGGGQPMDLLPMVMRQLMGQQNQGAPIPQSRPTAPIPQARPAGPSDELAQLEQMTQGPSTRIDAAFQDVPPEESAAGHPGASDWMGGSGGGQVDLLGIIRQLVQSLVAKNRYQDTGGTPPWMNRG